MTAQSIAAALARVRLPRSVEADYHAAIARVLAEAGVAFESECDLGAGYGRVDVFVPALGLAVELKVKGSLSDVTAQLHRYASAPQVRQLLLVTGSVRLGNIPSSLCGKPVAVVATWKGYL